MTNLKRALGLLLLMFLAHPALSKEEETHHYCSYSDVSGNIYHLGLVSEDPPGREARFFNAFAHQYIIFHPNNTYSFVKARKEITTQSKINESLAWNDSNPKKYLYVIGKKGDFALFENKQVKERYQCVAVTKSNNDYQAGDLVLTSYPEDENDRQLIKLYRRWAPSEPN